STTSASAYPAFPVTSDETITVPAIATPNEEPRFDTLRDKPDISPWSDSGKLDWTTLTDEVNMTPTPRPTNKSPGKKVTTLDVASANNNSRATPMSVTTNPARLSVDCERRSASLP